MSESRIEMAARDMIEVLTERARTADPTRDHVPVSCGQVVASIVREVRKLRSIEGRIFVARANAELER